MSRETPPRASVAVEIKTVQRYCRLSETRRFGATGGLDGNYPTHITHIMCVDRGGRAGNGRRYWQWLRRALMGMAELFLSMGRRTVHYP